MSVRTWFLALATWGCVVACSPHLAEVQKLRTGDTPECMQRRLYDVGLPLLGAADGWCLSEQDSMYGFYLRDEASLDDSGSSKGNTFPVVSYVHSKLPAASIWGSHRRSQYVSVEGDGAEAVMRTVHRPTAAERLTVF